MNLLAYQMNFSTNLNHIQRSAREKIESRQIISDWSQTRNLVVKNPEFSWHHQSGCCESFFVWLRMGHLSYLNRRLNFVWSRVSFMMQRFTRLLVYTSIDSSMPNCLIWIVHSTPIAKSSIQQLRLLMHLSDAAFWQI